MTYALYCVLCAALAAAFIYTEHKKNYVTAAALKGLASLMFVLLGFCTASTGMCGDQGCIKAGLILGCIADVMLNLRFVFESSGKKIFLLGILVFLAGHVMYLIALTGRNTLPWLWLVAGALLAVLLIRWVFARITAAKAFKIFGVFYLGTIMLMTCSAFGAMVSAFSAANTVFFAGAAAFLVSDIVLILNTFGGESKFSLRVTNLSFYYAAQLMIALSMAL